MKNVDAATRLGAGAISIRKWKHYDACLFLRDHVEVAPQRDTILADN